MKNDLNSLLIEGELVGDPVIEKDGRATCDFTIKVKRFDTDREGNPESRDVSFEFRVKTYDHLAEVCAEYLTQGRRVRIVGHLDWRFGPKLYAHADHVEFKPKVEMSKKAVEIDPSRPTAVGLNC